MNKKTQGKDLKSLLANSFKKKIGKPSTSFLDGKEQAAWKINKALKESKSENNKQLKTKDIQSHLKVVFLEALRKDNVKGDDNEFIEVDMNDFEISEREIELIDTFLTRFTIVSESSMNEHLDIMLMLKALPNKIN